MEKPQVEREGLGCGALGPGQRVVPPQRAGGRSECSGRCLLRFLPLGEPRRLSPSWACVGISSMRPGARSRRDGDGLAPTPCVQAKCFDPLVRGCVACNLLRTPDPRPAAGMNSVAPGTALQPQESVGAGAGAGAETALQLPALLLGAPALLGLALALVLVALVSWRRRQRRLSSPGIPEAHDIEQDEPPNCVTILSSGPLDATAPIWPSPREDPATTPPAHSVPVPATELGSTELVTTKTAGPEQ